MSSSMTDSCCLTPTTDSALVYHQALAEKICGSKRKKKYPNLTVKSDLYPAEEYTRRFEHVNNLLKLQIESSSKTREIARGIRFSYYMVGISFDVAEPCIIIHHSREHINTLRKLFRRPPENWHCRPSFSKRWPVEYPTRPRFTLVFEENPYVRNALNMSTSISEEFPGSFCGASIQTQGRQATVALSLDIDGAQYLLTVNHIFFLEAQEIATDTKWESTPAELSRNEDGENNYEDDDDDDDEDDDDYEDENNDGDRINEDGDCGYNQNVLCEDAERKESERIGNWIVMAPNATTTDEIADDITNSRSSFLAPWKRRKCQLVEPKIAIPFSRPDLDFAIVEVEKASNILGHFNYIYPTGPEGLRVAIDLVSKGPEGGGAKVLVVSRGRRVRHGYMRERFSYLGSPPKKDMCRVWTMVLDSTERILAGDCGSIVVDEQTFRVYGYVVASESNGHGLVVPLVDAFEQIKESFDARSVSLPTHTVSPASKASLLQNRASPERNTAAATALLKQLHLVVNSATFTDLHAIVLENEKLRSENERLKVTQEENCVLLTQKQNELNEKKEQALRHSAELKSLREEMGSERKEHETSQQSVLQELAASKNKVAELEKERQGTSREVTRLMTNIKDWETKTAKLEEKATELENLKAKADAVTLEAEKELETTKKDLSSAMSRLEKLEKYGYRFKEPKWDEITHSLQSLFIEAYDFINSYFNIDFEPQIINAPEAWSELGNHKSILRVLPLPRSNSAPAKLMRVAAGLCVLGTALAENLFQPTYLLGDSNELAELLDDLLLTDWAHERHLRAQLLSFDPEQQENNGRLRVNGAVVDVFRLVGDLLPPTQQSAFRDGLEKLCETAWGLWVQVQRLGPRVEPTLDAGGRGDLWRLLPAAPESSAPPRAGHADVKLAVWPCFLAVRPEGAVVLSDGFVVGKSQTQVAAREEMAEAVPERHRSARRRSRASTNGALAPGKSFLPPDSGKQSNGG